MSRNRRLLVAALTAVALFSVIVLTAGLSALQSDLGRMPPILRREAPTEAPEAGTSETIVKPHAETLPARGLLPMIAIAIALAVVLIFMIVTAEGRKLLVYTVLILLLLLLILLLRERAPESTAAPTPTPAQEAVETPAAPPVALVFEPAPWLILGASLGLGLLVVGTMALVGVRLWRRANLPAGPSPLPELAEEARQALAGLRAGHDFRDTIVRCYSEMVETLQEYRGLQRTPAMTPQEFARGLATTNLPQADIWRITRLFERVRYGQHLPTPEEEAEAVACLTVISQAANMP